MNCVALVGHGVPGGPGRRQLQGQPEEDCRVERVHGRPALGAVARVAGHSGPARDLGNNQGGDPFRVGIGNVGCDGACLRRQSAR